MTLRTYLPYDFARCAGVSDDEGTLAQPCDTCARAHFTKPGQTGDRQPWISPSGCDGFKNYISMEIPE